MTSRSQAPPNPAQRSARSRSHGAATRETKDLRSCMDRALAFLEVREHTRAELESKLARPTKEGSSDAAEIAQVLDELQRKGFQSDARAVSSLVTSKGQRLGRRRLQQDLQRRGASPALIAASLHAHPDVDVCRSVWRKKFKAPASDPKARMKQFRFLAARGFSLDSIRAVLGQPPIGDDHCEHDDTDVASGDDDAFP
jgi:regulatory protein